ncbi:hypothetical protein L208DRAFT_1546750 [Tricholoma matsutake]|nr:hypothetical protein L208DRAFT_1546750 [Tricholoma matsutake 945]
MREMKTISDEHSWTTKPCHGMNQWMRRSIQLQGYHHPYRKPKLYSRISLGMSNVQDRHCSTVTEPCPNFLNPNGSTSLVAIPSTLIISSQISTLSPMKLENPLSLESTSNCSMVLPYQPKWSKHMATGLSLGRHWLKPPSSSSYTDNKNFSCIASTSNGSSLHSPYSSTLESLTMTMPSESNLLSDATRNCRTSQSLPTSRSNGSTIQSTLLPPHPQNLPSLDNS